MLRQDLVDFAQRDWVGLAELKSAHWRERRRLLGAAEAFRVADDLRRYVAIARPDWPNDVERAADLASHIAVAENLQRVRDIRPR